MRFRAKIEGNERVRTFFAFFPVRVGDETRWFEKVTIREKFYCDEDSAWWRAEEFMDRKPTRFDLARSGSQKG